MLKRILKFIARSLTHRQRRRRLKPLYLKKRRRSAEAGFILPTVAVVSMVVVLMTAAMTIRSFDRARNASNVRVSQAAAEAAAPAIARAKVKIEALLRDPALPSRTPSTQSLYNAIKYNSRFTFGDETRLKLGFDINQDNAITADNADIKNDETLTTAWRFPIDTNNNGKFDTYTLYGIYFRSPSIEAGDFNRERNPLEARTPPVNIPIANSRCADILNADTEILDNGWYQSSNKLNKSFFVYTASVPITDNTNLGDRFETLGGNTSFYALEYQQDRSLIPLNQYAVWFNDDLELSPSNDFRINGRIHTNGNLLVGGRNNATVRFYQVDSQDSCFYQPENGKITVGGNVGNGSVTDTSDRNVVTVDLYSNNPSNNTAQIGSNNKSTEETGGEEIAYSDDAFNQRLALMKQAALEFCIEAGRDCAELEPPEIKTVLAINRYPDEVKNRFSQRLQENSSLNTYIVLSEELERYLRHRTRRVPYAEVLESNNDILDDYTQDNIFANLNTIEPPAEWREPTDNNTRLLLRTRQLEATSPAQQLDGTERYLGDRIRVGNNLPAYWKDGNNYVTAPRDRQLIAGINWTTPNDKPRYRSTQVQPFDTSEIAERGGFWERQTATNTGGLRIITGAGIYRDRKDNNSRIPALQVDSFLPDLSNRKLDSGADLPTPDNRLRIAGQPIDKYTLVWSDMMPMTGGDEQIKDPKQANPPNLRMRATAVYHYTQSTGVDQIPIACVSSYYDPTDETTAKNGKFGTNNGYPWGAGGNPLPYNNDLNGRSNNGIVYEAPYTNNNDRIREIGIYLPELRSQAKIMFPNGRIVNQSLQNALKKLTANVTLEDPEKPLSISDNAALDTAICALKILDGTIIPVNNNPIIPHGAIQEASFLDSREIKAISRDEDNPSSSTLNSDRNPRYDLDIEQRQPLEIRVTDINLSTGEIQETYSDPEKEKVLGLTRKKINPSQIDSDYLLPNSGIVYASRDDALRDDLSAIDDNSNSTGSSIRVQSSIDTSAIARLESQLLSPTDFKLDPTRRPNGIRLINGSDLSRDIDNRYRPEEKGLILVSDLPVYIKGDFNLHQTPLSKKLEEFQETLDWSNWSNFYTRRLGNLNPNFACRPGKAGCPDRDGDTWRSSTIIADTVTLLSNSFRDGFRNQGDYDLNNNTALPISQQTTPDNPQQATTEREKVSQNRKNNGFWDNSFVTSSDWWDTNSSGNPYPNQKNSDNSYVGSYLTNGVTPIQRRTNFPEYVMEICQKIPVETCQEGDWKIGYDQDGDRKLNNNEINSAITLSSPPNGGYKPDRLGAGTTALPALQPEDRRYPRRVAFQRDDNLNNQNQNQNSNQNNQQNNSSDRQNNQQSNPGNQQNNQQNNSNNQQSNPGNQQNNQQSDRQNNQQQNNQQNNQINANQLTPLGIDSQGNVKQFRYVDGNNNARPDELPRQVPNALWFKTTTNPVNPTEGESYSPNNPLFIKEISGNRPLLVPVLQIHSPDGSPSETLDRGNPDRYATNWLQTAAEDTTFNAVFMAGNSPSRPQEDSAGLPNFVRLLENWENRIVKIDGNFIQMRRSAYATAPFMPIRRDTATELATATDNLSWFDYAINKYPTGGANNDLPTGTPPYYSEPERHWQFDVALLSQSSDLFAQEFTTPSTSQPSELLREVSRDDPWVQTLLCAAIASDRTGKITATYTQYAISDKTQRPATCQNDTPDYPANLN
ncbi:hypothetical protein H6G17_25160 [Chroococcidiopsis sp. FACHB-1243]|uniref:hormogonium polysaccharide biosynthesis protein HpsA n=1 Tax=Chroococcidiopsis sp. [FACHB-1243] TaxID=2692781 RepID=UPI00177FA06F|nr:hormogonium polysaccharide biosynthesis protein HpsA [Chroococcidiopsis sp. [FACHB-1243]]MBD2308763.1 hypothetical protein [Chroococcidiopsis sp. [FACHB-1243]]